MSQTVPDFSRVGVVVAGDVMLDEYWFGPTNRISPEAPVPVVRVTGSEARAGGAANVAVNLASLGARTSLTGIVGRDANAAALGGLLRNLRYRGGLRRVCQSAHDHQAARPEPQSAAHPARH